MRFLLYVFALAIAAVTGMLGGLLVAVVFGLVRLSVTGEAGDFPAYSAGFMAATITWPLYDWLEARFGLNTTQTQGEAE